MLDAKKLLNKASDLLKSELLKQKGRGFLYWPLGFSLGCLIYFHLPFEPKPIEIVSVLIGLLVILATRFWLEGRFLKDENKGFDYWKLMRASATFGLLVGFGFLIACLRTHIVDHAIFPESSKAIYVKAVIIDHLSTDSDDVKLLLAPQKISGLSARKTPLRIRISLKNDVAQSLDLTPGRIISGMFVLSPPSNAFVKGGYDYAKRAWFKAIGAIGFGVGRPKTYEPNSYGLRLSLIVKINEFRYNLSQSLRNDYLKSHPQAKIGSAGMAVALVTGHQGFLSSNDVSNMRKAGIAHILSISGVHMAIVSGFIFFTSRALMALFPWFALSFNIKKCAALLSMFGVGVYLLISGAPAPAVRAAIVAWVAFGAIVFDQQALSMRSLALAALIILIFTPEAINEAGFQMSFAATAALLALFEAYVRPVREITLPIALKLLQATGEGIRLSVLSSLVASVATLPFGMAYFSRVPIYGVFANLLEAPVSTFIIMPSLVVATLFHSSPIAEAAHFIGHYGLGFVLWLAQTFGNFDMSVWDRALALPDLVFISAFGLFFSFIWRGYLRYLGLIPLLITLFVPVTDAPDLWIGKDGENLTIRQEKMAINVRLDEKTYGPSQFRQIYGLKEASQAKNTTVLCEKRTCVITLGHLKTSLIYGYGKAAPDEAFLATHCQTSSLIVLKTPPQSWPLACARLSKINEDALSLGPMTLKRKNNGAQKTWEVTYATDWKNKRLWTS